MVGMTEFPGRPVVEVRDLRLVPESELDVLRRCSFGEEGWMSGFIEQILTGEAKDCPFENYRLSYNRAHTLVARTDEGELMGWALVRHPSRRLTVASRWNSDRVYYGGRRADFNVFVDEDFRKRGVAKDLLLVAFNNFGRVDVYPHDVPSESFYLKLKRFVTAYSTWRWPTEQFYAREVF